MTIDQSEIHKPCPSNGSHTDYSPNQLSARLDGAESLLLLRYSRPNIAQCFPFDGENTGKPIPDEIDICKIMSKLTLDQEPMRRPILTTIGKIISKDDNITNVNPCVRLSVIESMSNVAALDSPHDERTCCHSVSTEDAVAPSPFALNASWDQFSVGTSQAYDDAATPFGELVVQGVLLPVEGKNDVMRLEKALI